MVNVDKFVLLSGVDIDFKGVPIKQPKLEEIRGMTYGRHQRSVGLLTISSTEIEEYYEENGQTGAVDPLLFLIEQSTAQPIFFLELQIAFLTYIPRGRVELLKDKLKITVFPEVTEEEDDTSKLTPLEVVIDRYLFEDFQDIIRAINYLPIDVIEDDINTDDEELKAKFMEKRRLLKKAKEKQRKREAASGKGLTFPNIVSSLCGYGCGYTLVNVWDLTVYQLYDQFYRLGKREEYTTSVQSLLAGADKKKVKLKNWMEEISIN